MHSTYPSSDPVWVQYIEREFRGVLCQTARNSRSFAGLHVLKLTTKLRNSYLNHCCRSAYLLDLETLGIARPLVHLHRVRHRCYRLITPVSVRSRAAAQTRREVAVALLPRKSCLTDTKKNAKKKCKDIHSTKHWYQKLNLDSEHAPAELYRFRSLPLSENHDAHHWAQTKSKRQKAQGCTQYLQMGLLRSNCQMFRQLIPRVLDQVALLARTPGT